MPEQARTRTNSRPGHQESSYASGYSVPCQREIELYRRTYYSLLRSSGDIRVRSLEETHSAANSSLHFGADSLTTDISASRIA